MKTADLKIGQTYLLDTAAQRTYGHGDSRRVVRVLAVKQDRPNSGYGTSSDGVQIEEVPVPGDPRKWKNNLDTTNVTITTYRHKETGQERKVRPGTYGYGGPRFDSEEWEVVEREVRLLVRPQQIIEPITPQEFRDRLLAEKAAKEQRESAEVRRIRERTERMEKVEETLTERGLMDILEDQAGHSEGGWKGYHSRSGFIQGRSSLDLSLAEVGRLQGFEVPEKIGKKKVSSLRLEDLEVLLGIKETVDV